MNPEWPSAHEIATAISTAARRENADPIEVLTGTYKGPKSDRGGEIRAHAFCALAHNFPDLDKIELAAKLGAARARYPVCNFQTRVRSVVLGDRGLKFSLETVNEVRAALGWPGMTLEDCATATSFSSARPVESVEPVIEPVVSERRLDVINRSLREGRAKGDSYPAIASALMAEGIYIDAAYLRNRAQKLGLAVARRCKPRRRVDTAIAPAAPATKLQAVTVRVERTSLPPAHIREAVDSLIGQSIPSRARQLAMEYALGSRMMIVPVGEPDPSRSALAMRRQQSGDVQREETTPPDQLFVEGYMGGVNSDDTSFPECFASRGGAYKAGWLRGQKDREPVRVSFEASLEAGANV